MKKALIVAVLATILIISGCVMNTTPSSKLPEKEESDPSSDMAPEIPVSDSTPTDIPSTPSDTSDEPVDMPISPNALPDFPIASMSKPYRIDNHLTVAQIECNKQRLASMGGLTGFSVYAVYDADTDSYSIEDTMGDYEAIDHMYIWNQGLTIIFRDYVTLHKWMYDIPDYLSINAKEIIEVSPEGYEFNAVVHDRYYDDIAVVGKNEDGRLTLNFAFPPIIVDDFYLTCGKID